VDFIICLWVFFFIEKRFSSIIGYDVKIKDWESFFGQLGVVMFGLRFSSLTILKQNPVG
ncbi:hypothetical protein CCACVL1_29620, partial [Corchorus capsularis]